MRSFARVLSLLVVVVLGVGGVVGCGSSDSSSTTTTTAAAKKTSPSYLFSFEGVDASMKPVAGSAGVYSFSMPVDSVSKAVTWFTDRPNRDAGVMKMTAFASLWSEDGNDPFKTDPPNVSFVYGSGNGPPKTLIATMSDLKIVANPNGSGELVQATMTVVADAEIAALAKTSGHLAAHAKRHTTPTTISTADTKKIVVFVDAEQAGNACCKEL